ncbi:DUF4286 family protein [Sphingomonas sp. SRS2]|uniref:DUF4286 family protein n=1 Tax=Sphingomonas sp. SRS2 TaxID=133190 RepID=UPI00061842DD|nr:DUF4286 family protein [Sphingomonas sp. SRS2]KKC25188.1 hypothetical protein WP12_14990 [Sphingomonas sp. SRS2]
MPDESPDDQYKLLVLSNPVTGREEEFNAWYSDQHLGDVLSVDGFVAAQRFTMVDNAKDAAADLKAPNWRYAAIYEIENSDPWATFAALEKKMATGEILISGSLNLAETRLIVLKPITGVVQK